MNGVERRPFPYATSHVLEEIEFTGPALHGVRAIAKTLGRDAMSEAARLAKPASRYDAARETFVYRELLATANLGTPAYLGSVRGRGRRVLLIEAIDGHPLTDVGDFAVWEEAARWLAAFHARPWPESSLPIPPLVSYDRRLIAADGRKGLERIAAGDRAGTVVVEALAPVHQRAVDLLCAAPQTLVHGDFYPSNVLSGDGGRVAVVDWEVAGVGPGVLDLAAFVSGDWSETEREALARAYHDESTRRVQGGAFGDFLALLDLASLHVALAWAGAPAGWVAPERLRQDWCAEAGRALARVTAGDR